MKKHLATAMGVVALLTSIGNANTITLANNSNVGPTWTYNVSFTNSVLNPSPHVGAAFFTIADFGNVTAASLALAAGPLPGGLAAWTVTQALLGTGSAAGFATLPYFNSAGVQDVTFTYIGAPNVTPGSGPFTITLVSDVTLAGRIGAYASRDTSLNPSGFASDANGFLLVPVGAPDGGSTVALFGIALLGVQALRMKLGAA